MGMGIRYLRIWVCAGVGGWLGGMAVGILEEGVDFSTLYSPLSTDVGVMFAVTSTWQPIAIFAVIAVFFFFIFIIRAPNSKQSISCKGEWGGGATLVAPRCFFFWPENPF